MTGFSTTMSNIFSEVYKVGFEASEESSPCQPPAKSLDHKHYKILIIVGLHHSNSWGSFYVLVFAFIIATFMYRLES